LETRPNGRKNIVVKRKKNKRSSQDKDPRPDPDAPPEVPSADDEGSQVSRGGVCHPCPALPCHTRWAISRSFSVLERGKGVGPITYIYILWEKIVRG